MLQKFKTTKLWCAIAGITTGIAIALGADAGSDRPHFRHDVHIRRMHD